MRLVYHEAIWEVTVILKHWIVGDLLFLQSIYTRSGNEDLGYSDFPTVWPYINYSLNTSFNELVFPVIVRFDQLPNRYT